MIICKACHVEFCVSWKVKTNFVGTNWPPIVSSVPNDEWVKFCPSCGASFSEKENRSAIDLQLEIQADDQIMKEWARVLDAIPPCRAHGSRCVPHALDWIAEMTSPRKEIQHG